MKKRSLLFDFFKQPGKVELSDDCVLETLFLNILKAPEFLTFISLILHPDLFYDVYTAESIYLKEK